LKIVDALEILSAGPQTTVQDLGRFGYGRYGVAPSGALDAYALRIGNLLVGNREDEAALEVTLTGLNVRVLTDLVVAITGADLQPRLNKKSLKMWCSHGVKKDDIISIRYPKSGCCAYLAVGGRIGVPDILGSKSTNLSAGFGGLKGRPLREGDILPLEISRSKGTVRTRSVDPELVPVYPKNWILRVIRGPQDDQFAATALKTFFNSTFKVSPQSNRFGIRLEGPAVRKKKGLEDSIISEGVIAGTVQVPGDGQPIIILSETVTGGYRKIATVISADLAQLGQIKPGNQVEFQEVSLDGARRLYKDLEKKVQGLRRRLSR